MANEVRFVLVGDLHPSEHKPDIAPVIDAVKAVLPAVGRYSLDLVQPGGQKHIIGRAAYFAFAHALDLDPAKLMTACPA